MKRFRPIRDMFREPVLRLVAYHVGFIILAAGSIFFTEYYSKRNFEKPALEAIANQNAKRQLAQIIQRRLQSIESQYRGLLLFENPHRIIVLKSKIDHALQQIAAVIEVLKHGGTITDVMPVNFYEADEIHENITYRRPAGETTEVALLDIAPKVAELEQSLRLTTQLLLKLLEQGAAQPLSNNLELITEVKQTDALLLRTRESANKIFYDIRQSNRASHRQITHTRETAKKIELVVNLIANTLVVVLAFFIARKIHLIIKLQRRTQAHNNWLSTVVDQSPASILVTDTAGRLEYVNKHFVEQTGYSAAEVKGKSPGILQSGETPPERFAELWRTIETGGVWRGELTNKTRDGRLFTEDAVIAPVLDEHAAIINYAAIKFDITEKKALASNNTQLQFEQNRLKTILDHAPIGVIISDKDDRIIWANEFVYRISGAKSLDGTAYTNLLPLMAKAGSSEEMLSTAAGRRVPILKHCQSILWNGSGVNLTTFVDLSQQKKLEADLAQKSKLESVGSLAAGIAHEINTPIQFISHNLTFLQDSFSALRNMLEMTERYRQLAQQDRSGTEADAEIAAAREAADIDFLTDVAQAAITESIEGTGRIAAIVKSIKAFSHPGSMEKSDIDINQLIRDALLISKNEWKTITDVIIDLADDIPLFPGLLNELQQVMLNLVLNAKDAIAERCKKNPEPPGRITISTRQAGDWVEISVLDNGSGIAADVREKVFDPFFTTKEVGKGTGQGLSISRNIIVKKHRGELSLTDGIDGGAGFLIRLPSR